MWYLYGCESGDLEFDFFTKNPSKCFTVWVLIVRRGEHNRVILSAVKKTVRRKLPRREGAELKEAHTSLKTKEYFFRLVKDIPFEIFALTLNKRRVYRKLQAYKDRRYPPIRQYILLP